MKKLGWWLMLTALFVVVTSGAGAECEHKRQSNIEIGNIWSQLDEKYHMAFCWEETQCLDCGVTLFHSTWEEKQKHDFSQEGDMWFCGHCCAYVPMNGLYHCSNCLASVTDVKERKESLISCGPGQPGEQTHHLFESWSRVRCPKCKGIVKETYLEAEFLPHDFDSDGDCVDCGYHDASQARKPLIVTLYPWIREACVGKYIAVTVAVDGGSGEYTYQWNARSDTNLSVPNTSGFMAQSACTWTFECTVTDTKTGQKAVVKSSPIVVKEHEWESETISQTWNQSETNRNHHYAVMTKKLICSACNAEKTVSNDEKQATLFELHNFESQNREFLGASLPFAKVLVCTDCGYQQTPEDRYYNALLACVQEKRNPMEDENFRKLLNSRYATTEMGDEKIKAVFECLEDAPEVYRMVYLLSLGEYELVDYPGVYFNNEGALELRMDFDTERSNEGFVDVFMHESGHGVDVVSRQPPEKRSYFCNHELALEIVADMEKDVEKIVRERLNRILRQHGEERLSADQIERIVQNFVNEEEPMAFGKVPDSFYGDTVMKKYYRMVRDELCDELGNLKHSQGLMVSDVYGGMTNNKIVGEYGHFAKNWPNYWYDEDGDITYYQFMEGFAEYFSAYMTGNGYAKRENLFYFPTAVPKMHNYVLYLEDYYTDLLLERYGAIEAK